MEGISDRERNKYLLSALWGKFSRKQPQVKIHQEGEAVCIEIGARISRAERAWLLETCRKRFRIDEEIRLTTAGFWRRRVTHYYTMNDPIGG